MSELCGVPLGEMRRDRQTPAAQVGGLLRSGGRGRSRRAQTGRGDRCSYSYTRTKTTGGEEVRDGESDSLMRRGEKTGGLRRQGALEGNHLTSGVPPVPGWGVGAVEYM